MTTTYSPPGTRGDTKLDWLACPRCRALVYRRRFTRLHDVCPDCGFHAPLTAQRRLDLLLDPGSARLEPVAATQVDPLGFHDVVPYVERLARARAQTGLTDAVLVATGTIGGHPLVVAAMDFRFMGGSLGTAAGQAVTAGAGLALERRLPLLLVTASGGARMQEGPLALMQMARTSNAMAALQEAGLLTVTLVTDPTYGGVAASFATLADVIVAEPGARMGFAGARVIEQTIRQRLPEGFQTAEFLLKHGLIDDVWPREELRAGLARLLAATRPGPPDWGAAEADPVLRRPPGGPAHTAWETVQLARDTGRPGTLDHVGSWLDGFVELHGDRAGADCPAVVGGLGVLDGMPVMVVGHQKGRTVAERVRRRFGMASPAGHRKAARLMRLAERLGVPVVTLVDTPGADPGIAAEEQGQAIAVAESIRLLGSLRVPVVAAVIGEGGSGGALALAAADRVLALEGATYSVISPEGCAAILWKTAGPAAAAAEALCLDAVSLLRLGVIDGIVPEPPGGAHTDPAAVAELLRRALVATLRELRTVPRDELVRRRRDRCGAFGAPATGR
ncbi:hypothetical protein GCM10010399_83360 [Dactylosporangium fulvum]|uniref:carboxyltransferase subunit alpha n=1 Tax=Dactylosporangium fulvum TaxID=53359 RepID=UPI0033809382